MRRIFPEALRGNRVIRRPSNQCLTGLINLSVSSSMDRFRGVTGICMKVQPPSSCGMPLVTAAWCGFLRDGIEGRWEREAGVGRLLAWKDVFGETQETGAAGCSIPLPVEPPPPRGRFPIDTVPCRRQALIGLTESSMKSRFLPVHCIRTIATYCPPPGRGREEALMSGWAVGVIDSLPEYRSR